MLFEELKKLVRNKTLLILLCILCCVGVCFAQLYSHHEQTAYLQSVFAHTGRSYSQTYKERLQALQPADKDSYEAYLHSQMLTNEQEDKSFFDTCNAADVYTFLHSVTDSSGRHISPTALRLMQYKYDYLALCLPQLQTDGSATDVYFDFLTSEIHTDLFVHFATVLLILCSVFAVFCVWTSFYEESFCNTAQIVFTAKRGRKLLLSKTAACLVFASVAFLLLFTLGYGFVFLRNDFTGIWGQSVASVNNMSITPDARGPFVPWGSMTVGAYFVAGVAVSWLVMLSFLLTAAAFGGLQKNILPTAGLFFGLQVAILVAIYAYSPSVSSMLFYLLRMTGTGLVYLRGIWFSEGGFLTLIPFAETVGAVSNVIVSAFLFFLSYCRFKRIDI
ncbi:MAG: hypothetical protein IJO14_07610 [Clostridia bacterium]|nr:hypothetical protein [Clostridia bacterium]